MPFSQEKRLTVTDFSSAGFELVRFYSSQSKHFQNAPMGGAFGPNWSSNWDRRLIVDGDNEVRALRPDGAQIVFVLNGSEWRAWLGDPSTLTKIPGAPADGVIWRFTDQSDTTESYDAEGRLLRLDFVDGRSFTLTYDVDGRLAAVQSRDGRKIVFGAVTIAADTRISTALVPDGTVISYEYSGLGSRLEAVSDQTGLRATYLYGDAGNSAHTGSDMAYLLTGVIDPNGQRYSTYEYDAEGLVTQSGLAGGAGLSTFSWGSNYVDISSSEYVERRTFALIAGAQRVTSIVRSACPGPQCAPVTPIIKTFTYDTNGYKNLVTDFNGTVTDYDHDVRGLEMRRIEAKGKDTQSENAVSEERMIETDWHAGFRVPMERRRYSCSAPNSTAQACSTDVSTRWQLESLSRYAYNTRGQTIARCEIDPSDATAMAYTCGSSVDAPPRVRQTLTTYCEAGDVAAPGSTCPLLGLVKTMNGPRTDVNDLATYTYYAADHASCASAPTTCAYRKGDLWKVTNALNQVTEYVSYDGAGRVKRMKDANGTITDLTYHARGWLATRTVRANSNGTANASLDAVTTLTYDNVGQVTRVTQADGAYIAYTYDAAHRLTAITDNLGNTLSYTLDAAGNRTAENTRDPSNTLTRTLGRVYDSLGRLDKLLNAQNAETDFDYDNNGNQTSVTDALLRETVSTVDPLNRLIKSTDALMGNTQYRYDARDNLTKVIDAKGLATDYVYDGLSDLMQLVSPDTGATNYTYDSAGNRATQTDARGVVSSYSYDVLNRLIGIGYPTASNNVAFTYDQNHPECFLYGRHGIGRLTGFSDPSGSTKLCYDRRGNVTRKLAVVNGVQTQTGWVYNRADRITQLIYPSGSIVNYSRDALGRISAISVTPNGGSAQTLISAVSYYPYGPVKQITWGNGATSLRSYDQNYWIDSINSSQASGLDLDFTLDPVGNITGISDVLGGTPPNNTYVYDELYRLRDIDTPTANVETYSYDAIGNRLSKLVGTGPLSNYTYATNSHRVLNVGGMARDYDDNGNTTSRNTGNRSAPSLTYDERNRLTAQIWQAGITIYQYNARGERVSKDLTKSPKDSRTFVYDESGRLLSEGDSDALAMQEFIWLDDLPVGVIAGGVLNHIQPDHLGSPRKLIDVARNTAIWDWPILNNPFGEAAPNEDPDGDTKPFVMNLRFPGQYFDAETGLHYNYFRDYEPGTGRYVESDPIGLRGGVSTYGYAGAAPIGLSDPSGLDFGTSEALLASCALGGPVNPGCDAAVVYNACKWMVAGAVVAGGAYAATQQKLRECNSQSTDSLCESCEALYRSINLTLSELKLRHSDLLQDAQDLFNTRPAGKHSWAGHQQQFRNKQKTLRFLLEGADAIGCYGYPPDAWIWATRATPAHPSNY